jgi:hypothetical protein
MTNIQAIINFAYFTANFPHNFIEMCWKDDKHLIEHLNTKFLSRVKDGYISIESFMRFFFDLDRENQSKLANWINENYKC